jgi:signal transduction histidine kinase
MTRLFLQLFTPVFIVTTLFLFNINYVIEPLVKIVLGSQAAYEAKEIIQVLNYSMESMNSVRDEDRKKKVKELQDQFLFDLELLDIRNIHLPAGPREDLQLGEFVSDPDHEGITYHLSNNAQRVWKLNMKQGESEDDNEYTKRIAAGPLKILTDDLLARPENEWKQALSIMSRKFKFPLTLLTLDTVDIEPQDAKNLERQGIIVFDKNNSELIYARIADTSFVVKVGPFKQPLIIKYIIHIFIALLGFLMGFVIWLLLRPIWRDLRKLQSASDNFGRGQLETRVQYSRYSPIKNISKAFNGMASHIQQLIGSHKELTRAVSHELRTPVSRLRFSLEMLAETNDPSVRNRFLREMNTDIEELDEMLAELLSYARMEGNNALIEFTPVVLADWLQTQTLLLQRDCHQKTVRVTHAGLPVQAVTCMDPKLMARALNNLFQNACRYADKQVHLDLTHRDGEYRLSVDDDGPGIPVENHEKIFEPFTRVDESRDRDSGGYGLGLAIVRQIVEAHQGSVKVIKSELGGAKFVICWRVESH